MKYSNGAVATARRSKGAVQRQPQGSTATARGSAASKAWYALYKATKAWAMNRCGDDMTEGRKRAARYLREARSAGGAGDRRWEMGDGQQGKEVAA
jgi:hypothetical protein